MFPTLKVQLLGDFRLVFGDRLLRTVSTARLKSLLAYLLLHRNAPQSRHHLAYLYWPDSTEAQAHNNLRQSFHRLRQALPEPDVFLQADARTIQWLPDSPFILDVAEFQKAVESAGSTGSLRRAADLYEGELLPGCYDEWVLVEREQLKQQFHLVLERLIRSLENQGNYHAAIRYSEQLLRSDPLREETYRQLIRLFMLSGNRTGATRIYQTCTRVLKHELNVEPSSETEEIFKGSQKSRLYPARLTVPQKRTNNLPTYLTTFIGRLAELEQLKQMLSAHSTKPSKERLLTLTGPGGCGKTRLAIQAASISIDEFPDGVWFIDVATLTDPNFLPNAIASILDIETLREADLLPMIIKYLQFKHCELIFDNCESMTSTCARMVELLLHSCPHLQIMATSREKLNLDGECVWPVSPLSLPDGKDLSVTALSQSDAARLFVERATSVLPTFLSNQANAASIVQICRRLEGLPLAIELAAARVAILTPAQIAIRLDTTFNLLASASPSAPLRHQTLQATMDWSYALLSKKEQTLFQRLSVFSGSFTLEGAETVCADREAQGKLLTSGILDLLSRLLDKSMVVVSDWTQGDYLRYRLLEPTWQYSNEKLHLSGDWAPLRQRHLEYFLNLVEGAESHFTHTEQAEWFDRLLTEHDNLLAAIDWALKLDDLAPALRLIGKLWYYWLARGYYQVGLKYLMRALEMTKNEMPSLARAEALRAAGSLYLWSENDWSRARSLLEEALEASRRLGDQRAIAGSLGSLGAAAFGQGDYSAAYSFLTESLSILPEVDDRHGTGWSCAYLGDLFMRQCDFEKAQSFYERSAANFRAIGDINSLGYPTRRSGVVALKTGNARQAASLFKDSLRMNLEVNYTKGIAACLAALAGTALEQGKFVQAAKLMGAAEMKLNSVAGKLSPTDQAEFDQIMAALPAKLEGADLKTAWAEGQAMKTEALMDDTMNMAEF